MAKMMRFPKKDANFYSENLALLGPHRLLHALETVPHGVLGLDSNGQILYANSACHRLLGYTDGEFVGTSILDGPESNGRQNSVSGCFTQLLGNQNVPKPCLITRRTKDGKDVHLQVDWENVRDGDGDPTGFDCVLTDVSWLKAGQDALRDSELWAAEIVDIAQEAIVSVDENQEIVLFNKGAERIFGYKEEQAIGRPLDILLPKDSHISHHDYLQKFANSTVSSRQMTQRSEIFGRRNNGEIFPAEASISRIKIGGKQIFTAFLRDISVRKRTSAALRENEENFRSLVETSQDMIARLDEKGCFTYLNSAWETTMGYGVREMLGRPYTDFEIPAHAERASECFKKVMKGAELNQYETVFVSKSGEKVAILAKAKRILDSNGRAVGIQATGHDITEQKRAERYLRQSQKLHALGELASGIAHDFNNILTPILGFSELLLENLKIEDESRNYVNSILGSARRAKDLVSQILVFSRNDQADLKVINLGLLTSEIVSLFGATLRKSIALRYESLVDSAPVLCDASQIHQAVLNLCVNAEHAVEGIGEISITIETTELHKFGCNEGKVLSGKYVRLDVTDSGMGVDEDVLAHIFEPFYSTKEVGIGNGLGLFTVFKIVQNHGGGIAVSTDFGKGTSFQIYLPLADGIVEDPPDVENPAGDGGVENILFVDDEESIRNLAKISLERVGYSVTIASDGQIALDIFTANPEKFELVVTDQTMPNMTGDVLALQLRKRNPDIPIILCSGRETAISTENNQTTGIRRFLTKPVTLAELGQAAREVLDSTNEACA